MRKSVKQQLALRVLSTAALMAMVSSIATAAFADTYDLTKGSVDILAEGGKQYITQWEDKDNDTCVKDGEGKEIRDREDSDITLTTKDETTGETKTTSNTVTIDAKEDNTANVTLENVDIEQPDSHWSGNTDPAPIEIKGDGNTKLELNGNNTVLSGNGKHAGIEKADVNGTGTLTIKDDVNDDGTAKTGTEADTTGKLVAGGYDNGAGIGGGYHDGKSYADTSNITITAVVISLPTAVFTALVSALVAMEMHQISALRAMHMLPPLEAVVLPLDPVINRMATAILPSPIMPLWRLLAMMPVASVKVLMLLVKPLSQFLVMHR